MTVHTHQVGHQDNDSYGSSSSYMLAYRYAWYHRVRGSTYISVGHARAFWSVEVFGGQINITVMEHIKLIFIQVGKLWSECIII